MKFFISILTCFLFLSSTPVMSAESGIFFDPARDGEGVTVFVDHNNFTLFFYTYRDSVYNIPPTVGPKAPTPDVDAICKDEPTWYIAQASNFDGTTATGTVYFGQSFGYPEVVVEGTVADVVAVGTFSATRSGSGWDLIVDWESNDRIPWYAMVYRSVYTFTTPLLSISD
jgi:hypothetical protein